MTWTRTIPTPVGVSAWRIGYFDSPVADRVQLSVGTATAQLDVEDAESLADYLFEAARTIRDLRGVAAATSV